MPKIFIIILNWEGWRETIECLESMRKLGNHEITRLRILIVDNGSRDESLRKLKTKSEELKKTNKNLKIEIIKNKENLGFAQGNNVGICQALKRGADYLMLLNNDTLVSADLIKNLLEVMRKDKKIGVLGPKIYFAPGREFHYHRYHQEQRGRVIWYAGGIIDWENVYCSHRGVDEVDKGQYDRQEETDFVSGCCLLARSKVFEKIGLLDKRYYLYLEDVDFSLRAKRAGFKVVYSPSTFLWHKNAQSSGKPGSPLHVYYQTRNRLLFGLKYAPLKSKISLLRESLKFLKENGVKRKAVIDFYLRKFGKQKMGKRDIYTCQLPNFLGDTRSVKRELPLRCLL